MASRAIDPESPADWEPADMAAVRRTAREAAVHDAGTSELADLGMLVMDAAPARPHRCQGRRRPLARLRAPGSAPLPVTPGRNSRLPAIITDRMPARHPGRDSRRRDPPAGTHTRTHTPAAACAENRRRRPAGPAVDSAPRFLLN